MIDLNEQLHPAYMLQSPYGFILDKLKPYGVTDMQLGDTKKPETWVLTYVKGADKEGAYALISQPEYYRKVEFAMHKIAELQAKLAGDKTLGGDRLNEDFKIEQATGEPVINPKTGLSATDTIKEIALKLKALRELLN